MISAKYVLELLYKQSCEKHAEVAQRFFKTGKGEYGEGDIFWGIRVPQLRTIARKVYRELDEQSWLDLMTHEVHEVRLTALFILTHWYEKAKTIRFHFEAQIPTPHRHLMFGLENGFMKTSQWSQRPHLSLVKYYREEVLPFLSNNVFIEDTLHGKIQDDITPYNAFNEEGWNKHKLWIYHPEGSIKRSLHLDGRKGTRKFTNDDRVWGYTE